MYGDLALASAVRVAVAIASAAAAVAAFAGPGIPIAAACSCGGVHPARDLSHFDAAFVGTAAARRVAGSFAYWTFDVAQAVKGGLPARIVVRSAAEGSACGLEPPAGRIGLLLLYDGARYESSLCYQTDPHLLARYALPNARVLGGPSNSAWPWWRIVIGAGALVTLTVGLLSLRRRA